MSFTKGRVSATSNERGGNSWWYVGVLPGWSILTGCGEPCIGWVKCRRIFEEKDIGGVYVSMHK